MKKFYDKNSCTVIDLHTYAWDLYPVRSQCAAAMINSHLPEGGVVVDYGCGRMYLRQFLRENIVYVPIDIVSRCKGCIICDFSSGEPLPRVECDIAMLNGVMQLGEKYDRRLIKHMMEYSDFILSDRRLDHILGRGNAAEGYKLEIVTKQEFPHGAHDGRPQDEYLFRSTVERRARVAESGHEAGVEAHADPDVTSDGKFTIKEWPFGPLSLASEPHQGVEVGSRWQGMSEDAWAGKLGTVVGCDPVYAGRGTVEVEYEDGGWDSFWLDSFLRAFDMISEA